MIQRPDNYLLEQLPAPALDLLLDHLHTIELKAGETLYEPEDEVDRVIFPTKGLLSVISVMEGGATAETSMVGRNGAVGCVEACGSGLMTSRIVVQMPGEAWAVAASRYRGAFDSSLDFRRAIATNIELQIAELRQNLACGRLHHLEARLARWLLDCQDVSGVRGSLPITQEFLSDMLSVQRTSVTTILGQLHTEGLVDQGRGHIAIKDPHRLEGRACECRRAVANLRATIQPDLREARVRSRPAEEKAVGEAVARRTASGEDDRPARRYPSTG